MPRKGKTELERLAGTAVGRGAPAGIIRNPIRLPPMVNIKDARNALYATSDEPGGYDEFDSDEDYELDERLGDELAKVEEQIR